MGDPQTEPETYIRWQDMNHSGTITNSESAKEKRDRLSKEENKRLIEARKRGGRVKF